MKRTVAERIGKALMAGCAACAIAAFGGMPDVERIALPGEYPGHASKPLPRLRPLPGMPFPSLCDIQNTAQLSPSPGSLP